MDIVSDTEAPPPSGGGTGDFFAVDRRAWARVCGLGMNAVVAYLVLARGTGGDNRTTKWSANAIEGRTGISRSRAAGAIADLERVGAVVRDPASRRDRPKYRIAPAHEIPGCEGFPPPPLSPEQQWVFDRLGDGWTAVPGGTSSAHRKTWKTHRPREVADELVGLGRAVRGKDTEVSPWEDVRYRVVSCPHDAEAAAKPDWIWLPNALVDGVAGETPPVELVRQTGSAPTLRLLVDLYGAQNLDEDGGIPARRIRQGYTRHKAGERGPYVVWGFVPDAERAWPEAPFVAPHLTGERDETGQDTGWTGFWACWRRLRGLGLVEVVAHLVDADTAEGEVIHPMALDGTGLGVEREVARAATRAGLAMITPGQGKWAKEQGVVALAPVLRHIEGVQMLGIARLRYRPRTSRTLAFAAREAEWREVIARLGEIARGAAAEPLATSR
jgi:hypothetical protein